MRHQVTEREPLERRQRGLHCRQYLFLVLEGARLEAGGMRIALGDIARESRATEDCEAVVALRIGRGEVRALAAAGDGTWVLDVPDARMSGTHARIVWTGAAFVLEDAGSTNGTLVNARSIARHELRDGDLVELGQTIFLYREIEEPIASHARNLDASAAVAQAPGFATLDPELARRLRLLARVALSPLSILLLGETGTGKEVLAQGVHELSRRPGPFVAVNCGAIPHNLVESHLFGHVRGAFSGALRDEPGLVRSAQHGTLLLDEIGDLPASSQAALLRILQEHEVMPVGSTQTAKVDVRVIAATHMPLMDLVERGAFRRDLYARLAGYTFMLPPLRDRRVDLGLLVASLRTAGKLGAPHGIRLHGEAARTLVCHDWPMNVRELEQCLLAATILSEDGVITADDLPPAVAATVAGTPATRSTSPAGHARAHPDVRARLVALLAEHDRNLSAVARALGTSRTQVYRLIERYGLAARRDRSLARLVAAVHAARPR